ncbi:MAG: ABC transporter substrate-binding protein [Acidobacteria bacterium]|nr:ABC transporter substrate-binding protein [Acidobacteriota bacterium]
MFKSLKLFIAALAAALFAACLFFSANTSARGTFGQEEASAGQPRALTAQERRGKAVYLRGESPSGGEVVAAIGEIEVPGSTVNCAGCHGLKGEGKTEGGVTAGGLAWSNLIKPYGHTHPSGRKHGPFNESSFIRAVTGGVDPGGNELMAAMPRYRMPAADMADLIAYLKRIETDRDPGVGDDAVKVGTLLPSTGPLAETGAAMRDVLAAYFEDVNSRGGVYNRKVELRVAEMGTNAANTAANVKSFSEREQVFALVGGFSAGADVELAALAAEQELPLVGPSTLMTQTASPVNRQVFYLMPGVAEQSRALVNFAAERPGLKKSKLFVAYPETELARAAAAAIEDQAKKAGWGASQVVRVGYARAGFDAAQLVRRLKQEGAEVLFFLGSNGEDSALIKEAATASWTPNVFLLGVFAGSDLTGAVTTGFRDKIFLSFPTLPSDITPAGMAEFRALHEKYKFAPRHVASQLSAFAAAKVFVESLKRAGRELTRERFVAALEGLYDYETGVMPRLTFGPNRRVGAAGASVVTIDPDKKAFAPVGKWVKAF